MGHSMGGHGALTIALKNPAAYKSVSAFAPICNPTQVPWGHKVGAPGEEAGTAAAGSHSHAAGVLFRLPCPGGA